MLNNIVALMNFRFFTELFLIIFGVFLIMSFVVLKVRNAVRFELHKALGRCIYLVFLMAACLTFKDLLFFFDFVVTDDNHYTEVYASIGSDMLGVSIKLILCLFASAFFYIITEFLDDQKVEGEFLLILYFCIVGLLLLCVSNDLISSYLAIELISLSSYLLASYRKNSNYSIEAGLKYFVMGSLSSAFFVLGCSFVYASSGSIVFSELNHLFSNIEISYPSRRISLLINNADHHSHGIDNLIFALKNKYPNLSVTYFEGLKAMSNEIKTGIPAWSDPSLEYNVLNHMRKHSLDKIPEEIYEVFRSHAYFQNKHDDLENCQRICYKLLSLPEKRLAELRQELKRREEIEVCHKFYTDILEVFKKITNNDVFDKHFIENFTALDQFSADESKKKVSESLLNLKIDEIIQEISLLEERVEKWKKECFISSDSFKNFLDYRHLNESNWRELAFKSFISKVKAENPNISDYCLNLLYSTELDLVNLKTPGTTAWKKIVLEKTIEKLQKKNFFVNYDLKLLLELDNELQKTIPVQVRSVDRVLKKVFEISDQQSFLLAKKTFLDALDLLNSKKKNFTNSNWNTEGYIKELEKLCASGYFNIDKTTNTYYKLQSLQRTPIDALKPLMLGDQIELNIFKRAVESNDNLVVSRAYAIMNRRMLPLYFEALDFKDIFLSEAIEELKKKQPKVPKSYFEILHALNSGITRLFNWDNNHLLETNIFKKTGSSNESKTLLFALNTIFFEVIMLGLLILFFSIFIKLSAAPFHLWSLDVYEGSPTISTFFFSVMIKLSLFMFLIRLGYSALQAFITEWQFYSILVAFVSLIIGAVGGLKQRKMKTLLAYSSINHTGYALLAFSMGSFYSLKVLIIYLIIYMLSGMCVWFSLLLLKLKERKSKYNKELTDLVLLGKSNPAIAFSLSVTLFSIAGLPPFIGFITKVGVFLALLKEEFYVFCIAAVLCSVISTFYYIRIVKTMFFENVLVGKLYYPIKTNKTWLLSFFTFLLIFLFVNPKLFFLIIHLIVDSFQ
jgi:NADH:ubiquinone oxidoreductase subunit 2 (subunit N)